MNIKDNRVKLKREFMGLAVGRPWVIRFCGKIIGHDHSRKSATAIAEAYKAKLIADGNNPATEA